MTGDDLISMHKATVEVIENMSLVPEDAPMYRVAAAIKTLAVVQRDILAGTLKAVLGEGP